MCCNNSIIVYEENFLDAKVIFEWKSFCWIFSIFNSNWKNRLFNKINLTPYRRVLQFSNGRYQNMKKKKSETDSIYSACDPYNYREGNLVINSMHVAHTQYMLFIIFMLLRACIYKSDDSCVWFVTNTI